MGSPAEVEEIFDTISYAKGSCVIRMLHDWIGTEVRRGERGLREKERGKGEGSGKEER